MYSLPVLVLFLFALNLNIGVCINQPIIVFMLDLANYILKIKYLHFYLNEKKNCFKTVICRVIRLELVLFYFSIYSKAKLLRLYMFVVSFFFSKTKLKLKNSIQSNFEKCLISNFKIIKIILKKVSFINQLF